MKGRGAANHPLFGPISFGGGLWENPHFALWGYADVQLIIAADRAGPTALQEAAFVELREARSRLLPACLSAVETQRLETGGSGGTAFITGLSIPALAAPGSSGLWTLWFGYPGEEHWSYGVQTADAWRTIQAFAED